jgi:hypothetical protein
MTTVVDIIRKYIEDPSSRQSTIDESHSLNFTITPYSLVMIKSMIKDIYRGNNVFNVNYILCEIMKNDVDRYKNIILLQQIAV